MRFHWMHRGDFNSIQDLKDLSAKLDDSGYYSVLLTYHSKMPDVLLQSFAAASNNQKLKYMIAMRTYAISPEYLSMICNSYNKVFPNKLIFNIASGDIHDDETSIQDLVLISDDMDSPVKRLRYTREWLEKFFNLASKGYMPEIIMAGHSDTTRQICKDFNGTHLSMLNEQKKYILKENAILNNKQMVGTSVLVRDSMSEAGTFILENGVGGLHQGDAIHFTTYGSKDDIKKEIKSLSDMGVTDVLLSSINMDTEYNLIHEIVKEIVLEEKS